MQRCFQVTGGRNGFGAKLTNIFSTEFVVETCDGQRGRRYKQVKALLTESSQYTCTPLQSCMGHLLSLLQVFNSNMSKKSEPKITSCKATDNWTSITFSPDLAKFGMEGLEEHVVMLMRKRVYDMAGVLGKTVKVTPMAVSLYHPCAMTITIAASTICFAAAKVA